MDEPHFTARAGTPPEHRPYWKRVHHSPFFWVAAFLILLAMVIYVVTENLSWRPGRTPQRPVPAVVP